MKIDDVIFASLRSETTYKLIYRVPESRLLRSSLPGKASRMYVGLLSLAALRTHVESLG